MLDPRIFWPVFPLLLLIVVVCLTWAMVYVVRQARGNWAVWVQAAALFCYLAAAVTAILSEKGQVSANLHRPFSLLTQLAIVVALAHFWKRHDRPALVLNACAWAAILADTALHFLMAR
ncbi:MAG: hypothetical protein ACREI3_07940 [Nitrospirales bacterium]